MPIFLLTAIAFIVALKPDRPVGAAIVIAALILGFIMRRFFWRRFSRGHCGYSKFKEETK